MFGLSRSWPQEISPGFSGAALTTGFGTTTLPLLLSPEVCPGQKKTLLNFANVSATEDQISMKFETYVRDRVVMHQEYFGKDLCTYARTRSKNVHTRLSKLHINLCLLHACLVLLCAYLLNRSSDLYEILILRPLDSNWLPTNFL